MAKKASKPRRAKTPARSRPALTKEERRQPAQGGTAAHRRASAATFMLSADKTTITLRMSAGEAAMDMVLNAAQVDKLIASIATYRTQMEPAVAPELAVGRQIAGVFNPRFRIGADAKTAGTSLVLRHPGFGWIGYFFPQQEAEKISGFLQAQKQPR